MYFIKLISAEDTYMLRQKVLRPKQNIENCKYPGDHDEHSRHWGAYDEQNIIVGIISLYRQEKDLGSKMAHWRFRGMATDDSARGLGLGKKLLRTCIEYALSQPQDGLWCNARTHACGFYEKNGFKKYGDEFTIDPIGPHYVMAKFKAI